MQLWTRPATDDRGRYQLDCSDWADHACAAPRYIQRPTEAAFQRARDDAVTAAGNRSASPRCCPRPKRRAWGSGLAFSITPWCRPWPPSAGDRKAIGVLASHAEFVRPQWMKLKGATWRHLRNAAGAAISGGNWVFGVTGRDARCCQRPTPWAPLPISLPPCTSEATPPGRNKILAQFSMLPNSMAGVPRYEEVRGWWSFEGLKVRSVLEALHGADSVRHPAGAFSGKRPVLRLVLSSQVIRLRPYRGRRP